MAAIRWHNGSIQPIAKVQGSSSYIDLMAKLSRTTPETRFPHDLPTDQEKKQYVLGRLQRLFNKFFGRSANAQTKILADMLRELKLSVQGHLPYRTCVTHAVVSLPDSIGLTEEELSDTLDNLGIRNSMAIPDTFDDLHSAAAAYAGLGHGLCETYLDAEQCRSEDDKLPEHSLLVIDFSNAALSMAIRRLQTYRNFGLGTKFVDAELEFASDQKKDKLFENIDERMRCFVRESNTELSMIILTGDKVLERQFKETLGEASGDVFTVEILQQSQKLEDGDLTTVFATAMGAAEVAKR